MCEDFLSVEEERHAGGVADAGYDLTAGADGCMRGVNERFLTDLLSSAVTEIQEPAIRRGLLLRHWQPVKARVAADTVVPGATINDAFAVVELVFNSDGLQSGVALPFGTNARASIV